MYEGRWWDAVLEVARRAGARAGDGAGEVTVDAAAAQWSLRSDVLGRVVVTAVEPEDAYAAFMADDRVRDLAMSEAPRPGTLVAMDNGTASVVVAPGVALLVGADPHLADPVPMVGRRFVSSGIAECFESNDVAGWVLPSGPYAYEAPHGWEAVPESAAQWIGWERNAMEAATSENLAAPPRPYPTPLRVGHRWRLWQVNGPPKQRCEHCGTVRPFEDHQHQWEETNPRRLGGPAHHRCRICWLPHP